MHVRKSADDANRAKKRKCVQKAETVLFEVENLLKGVSRADVLTSTPPALISGVCQPTGLGRHEFA